MPKDLNYLSQLVDYIKKNLKKGYTKESLRWALIGQEHSKMEVERALNRAEEELAKEAPLLKTKPKITYELVDSALNAQSSDIKKKSFLSGFFD